MRYYSVPNDGSEIEQEMVLFLKDSAPVIKFVGVESHEPVDARGLQSAITTAISQIHIPCSSDHHFGLSIDRTNVNMGVRAGLGAKIREMAAWLVLVYCFNHRIELASKMGHHAAGTLFTL